MTRRDKNRIPWFSFWTAMRAYYIFRSDCVTRLMFFRREKNAINSLFISNYNAMLRTPEIKFTNIFLLLYRDYIWVILQFFFMTNTTWSYTTGFVFLLTTSSTRIVNRSTQSIAAAILFAVNLAPIHGWSHLWTATEPNVPKNEKRVGEEQL